jgi:hypothetical protein
VAHMIPRIVSGETESAAERKLFSKIRDELPDEWSVLHSLGLAIHHRKPWAEIDFVLVGPTGVYCLEVKGGRIGRSEGIWTTTDRDGRTSRLKESPFSQVGSASAALRNYLLDRAPAIRKSITGYGLATPDVKFNLAGPDVVGEIVYDDADSAVPFDRYIKRLADYWRSRLGATGSELNVLEREKVVSVLCADFDLRPSLQAQVGRARDELARLTSGQLRVFQGLRENPRVVVRGGAGTGKTLLAVEEARRLAADGESVLLTCFNRRLAEYLAPAADGLPSLRIIHLHGLMTDVVAKAGLKSRLPDAEATDLSEVFYPDLCLEAFLDGAVPQFDAVIIDEGQDLLLDSYIDVFDGLLSGGLRDGRWRVFLDPNQDIFENTGQRGLARFLAARPTTYGLSVNCRNTASIATSTSLLSGAPLDAVLGTEGPDVVQEWYANDEQQRHMVSKVVRQWIYQGIRPADIVVLSPRRLENSCLSNGLISVPAPLTDLGKGEPAPGGILFSTVHGFKGLESLAIALADVDNILTPRNAAAVYVGASRAQILLAVFLRKSPEDEQAYAKRAFEFGQRMPIL